MNIIFMGTPDFSVPCLEALVNSGENVTAVFTQPDKARGRRGNKLLPSPVKECALQHNIPVFSPSSLKSGEDAENSFRIIGEHQPDLIIVVAYGKILPKRILDAPKFGCINIHASLLPKYRGAAPIQRCVLNGEKETGVTSMFMEEGLDTGDILLVRKTEIGENETSSELWNRLSHVGASVLLDTIKAVKENSLHRIKQDDTLATYSPMISKDMCLLDFSKSAHDIHRLICGLSDSPCAYAYLNGKRLKFFHSEISYADSDKPCGSLLTGKGLCIVCGDGKTVKINELQYEGGKRMDAEDFLRGNHIKDGDILSASAEI